MSNDFDLNRVPFPLICLMGEVAEYADWGERGMLFITILIARLHWRTSPASTDNPYKYTT